MYRWLEHQGQGQGPPSRGLDRPTDQGEDGKQQESGVAGAVALPPKVGAVMEHIMKPYVGGSNGTQVLGLLLR